LRLDMALRKAHKEYLTLCPLFYYLLNNKNCDPYLVLASFLER
jgi:hypothetical protein